MGIKGQEGNCILLLKAFGISLFFLSALGIRMGLIVYGMYQDQKFNVRYTDIDYDVYNDASRYL
ncbi:GPI mannosyltransferase, partial [Entamoeba histolytica HM-3:IMSS]